MVQNGTEAHLEKLFRQHAGKIRNYARRRGASTQDAEEIVIDTFVIYWLSAKLFGMVDAYVDAQFRDYDVSDVVPRDGGNRE